MVMKNKYFLLLILFAVCFAGSAFAASSGIQTTDIIGVAESKATSVFKAVRGIIFIVGGFGLVALAFFAIFGKLKWTWFASLAVGLAILAAAGAIIDYATTNNGSTVGSNMGDTLTGTSGSYSR